jgi:ribosomal protein S18 acetylase RimI-like enzyme
VTTLRVRAARAGEREAALHLALQHVPAPDRPRQIDQARRLLARGALEPDGLLVGVEAGQLVGALICTTLPGASSHLWPPQTLPTARQDVVADQLLQAALEWLRRRGAKLAQAILSPAEDVHAGPLPRNGLTHTTQLVYLRHALRDLPQAIDPNGLRFETYHADRPEVFHRTLMRTYEGTLDCPEVDGVRDVTEIIQGHQTQGQFRPERWLLARRGGEAVGVLLLNAVPEWQGWEVAYVGVVPEARCCGIGRTLTCKALAETRAALEESLVLAVDRRNEPAARLYRDLGFEPFDRREVYLLIFSKEAAASS